MSPNAAADLELVASTYRKLMTEVGNERVGVKALQRMLDRQDVFRLPEQPGTDHRAVQKNLTILEGMLREKRWLTPDVISRIGEVVKALIEGVVRATLREEIALENSGGLIGVRIPNSSTLVFSPDGKWALSSNRPKDPNSTADWTLNLYNTKTASLIEIAGPNGLMGSPNFSADGSHVLFPLPGNGLYSVPFSGGKLNWPDAMLIGNLGDPGPAVTYMHFGKDPARMVGGQLPKAPHLFDIAKRTRVPIDLKPFLPDENSLIQLGIVPGTDSLFMKSHDTDSLGSHRIRLATYSLDAQGKLQPLGSQGYWDPKSGEDNQSVPTFVQWLSDGTPVFGYMQSHLSMQLKVGAASKRDSFSFADPQTDRYLRLQNLIPRPHAAEGIILALTENNNGAAETAWAIWVNLDAGKIENAFALPQDVHGIQFSADGRTLFGYRRVSVSEPNEYEIVTIDFVKRLLR